MIPITPHTLTLHTLHTPSLTPCLGDSGSCDSEAAVPYYSKNYASIICQALISSTPGGLGGPTNPLLPFLLPLRCKNRLYHFIHPMSGRPKRSPQTRTTPSTCLPPSTTTVLLNRLYHLIHPMSRVVIWRPMLVLMRGVLIRVDDERSISDGKRVKSDFH